MLICDLRRLCVLEIVQSDAVLQKAGYYFGWLKFFLNLSIWGSGQDFCYILYIIDKCLY